MKNSERLIHSFADTDSGQGNYVGLTKREYFAGIAMQAIISNADSMRELTRSFTGKTPEDFAEGIGRLSKMYADGLLKELEETQL